MSGYLSRDRCVFCKARQWIIEVHIAGRRAVLVICRCDR